MKESGCSSIRPVSDMHTGLNLSISKAKVLCINAKPEAPMTVYGDPLDSLVKKTSLQVLGRKGDREHLQHSSPSESQSNTV